jgi:hypothetical protein
MSMTMAAFSGIAWYIAIELNIRLFYLFKRRKGTTTDKAPQTKHMPSRLLCFNQAYISGAALCARGES